jgi:hypothetical protein
MRYNPSIVALVTYQAKSSCRGRHIMYRGMSCDQGTVPLFRICHYKNEESCDGEDGETNIECHETHSFAKG